MKSFVALLSLGALFSAHCLCAPIEWPQDSPRKRPPNADPIIVIDPGHGGSPGSVSQKGIKEKDVTLGIARKLEELIQRKGTAQVFLTRRVDRPMALVERRELANQRRCDLFVSLHANASRLRRSNHIEVHYSSPWSKPLAQAIADHLSSEFPLEARVENVAWTVLWDNWAPLGAVLIETMHLSNDDGAAILTSEEGQRRVATSIFLALEETLRAGARQGNERPTGS